MTIMMHLGMHLVVRRQKQMKQDRSRLISNTRWTSWALALLTAALLARPSFVQAQQSDQPIMPERFPLEIESGTLKLAHLAQPALGEGTDRIRTLLINVHGTFRNAELYHRVSQRIANRARRNNSTLIFTPQFPMLSDLRADRVNDSVAYWTNPGWKRGDLSQSRPEMRRPGGISSYAALEQVIDYVANHYPKLERVVVVGHSAGGQYTNRFAASNRVHDELVARGIDVHYIVSNPSSYVYFCDHRLIDEETNSFGPVPRSQRESCPHFNRYTRGSDGLNTYMARVGLERLKRQYAERDVTYIMGADDNDPDGAYLDRTCGALLQGPHRLARAQTYHAYLAYRLGPEVHERHHLYVLDGVGHSAFTIFLSDLAVRTIYDQLPASRRDQAREVTVSE